MRCCIEFIVKYFQIFIFLSILIQEIDKYFLNHANLTLKNIFKMP